MSQPLREPAPGARDRRVGDRRRTPGMNHAVDIVHLMKKRWPLFRNVAISVTAAILMLAFALPSIYSTSAVVMIEPRKNNITAPSEILSETPTDPASIQNQIQLLTSRDLAAEVVDKLDLTDDPEFGARSVPLNPLRWFSAEEGRAARNNAAINAFLKHLAVSAVGLSSTISVTASSRDPGKAALVANTVVATYLDMQAAMRIDVAQRTTDWLLTRIRQLGQQVQVAEAGIQRYKAENNLTDTTSGSLVDQQLAAINAQLVTAREDLAAKQAENARIEALVDSGHAADVSQIISSPLIIQLREQQTDLIRQQAQFATRYGPRHPKMIAAESQARDLNAKIAEEVNRIAGTVRNEVDVARAQVASLEDSLQRAEVEAASQNMARVKLQSLEANAASTRSMYESFVTRLRETQGQDAAGMVDARQISHAPVPSAPSSPPRLLIALGAFPVGALFGLLAVLLAERFNGAGLQTSVPADPLRGLPVLAELPASVVAHCAEIVVAQPVGASSRSLRALAERIAAQGPRIIVVTSVGARDTQTGFATGLARAAAQLGLRVIMLDGDAQRPSVAARLGLPMPRAGLLHMFKGAARLSQLMQKDPRSSALVLSAAAPGVAPQTLWSSAQMARLTTHLRRVSDLVIVDGVPIARQNELPLIASQADGLIVVAADTPCEALAPALDYLKSVSAAPVGLVLAS